MHIPVCIRHSASVLVCIWFFPSVRSKMVWTMIDDMIEIEAL